MLLYNLLIPAISPAWLHLTVAAAWLHLPELITSKLKDSDAFKFAPEAAAAAAVTAGIFAVCIGQLSFFPVPILISDKSKTTSIVGCALCQVFALQSLS